jgi:EAL domain-containing protein (putative c-di-GMP-specific phosphodiesterase class I)
VVAEGVKDRQTQQMLAGIGCDAAQGYYLSRPQPAEAVAPWLRETQSAAA